MLLTRLGKAVVVAGLLFLWDGGAADRSGLNGGTEGAGFEPYLHERSTICNPYPEPWEEQAYPLALAARDSLLKMGIGEPCDRCATTKSGICIHMMRDDRFLLLLKVSSFIERYERLYVGVS